MLAASARIFFIRCVRIERFPFDSNGCKQTHHSGIVGGGRLFLNDGIQQFPKRVVTRRNKVRGNARCVGDLMAADSQRRKAGKSSRSSSPTRRPGWESHLPGSCGRAASSEGRRTHHEIALGNLPRVSGRQNEILAALSLVRARDADVNHPAIIKVIDTPKTFGGISTTMAPYGCRAKMKL